MTDVFISYARANQDVAAKLADDLTVQGYEIWWDTRLVGSDDYHHVLLEQLNKARAVIVIWSDVAVKSRFVIDEANRALNQDKLISTCLPDFDLSTLPLGFGGRHTDCVEKRGKIIEALKTLDIITAEEIEWELHERAENDEVDALFELGQRYWLGKDFERDETEAIRCFLKATNKGHADSMFHLGWMYDNGQGVLEDPEQSAQWHYKALQYKSDLAYDFFTPDNIILAWCGGSKKLRTYLQKLLATSNHYSGSIDGKFGPKTIAAIKALAGKE